LIDDVPATTRSYRESDLPTFLSEGPIGAHVFLSGEGRPALVPRAPSRLSFFVDAPPHPRLRFAIATAPLSADGARANAEFRIRIRSRTGTESVFHEVLDSASPRRWLDREVDLTPWAGARIEVSLETSLATGNRKEAEGGTLTLWGNPTVENRDDRRRPDLILISVDCLRADHVGAYGYSRPTTPRLDSFAERSVVFESAVASAPWTIPSHMSMLTGLPPSLHGLADHQDAFWGGTAKLLSPAVPYLPELLARAGYETHAVVTGAPLSTDYGFQRGFSTFRELAPDASAAVDSALNVLSRTREEGQFLFLHLVDPHAPYQPKVDFHDYASNFIERFGPRPDDISDLVAMVGNETQPRDRADVEGVIQLYDAAIAYVDQHLGRLFDELEARGILEHAIVVVTADHGEGFFEHGLWQHSKSLYQDLVHVPLIVRWPDRAHARVAVPAGLVDILPTFLEAAGIPAPPTEGEDLRRLLSRGARSSAIATASEVNLALPGGTRSLVSFRDGESKYIATLAGAFDEIEGDEILHEELYDLARDPLEAINLVEQDQDAIEAFRGLLRTYVRKGRRVRTLRDEGSDVDVDEETLRQLRELGYVP
jgi:arylsulfatase A-like enzyme